MTDFNTSVGIISSEEYAIFFSPASHYINASKFYFRHMFAPDTDLEAVAELAAAEFAVPRSHLVGFAPTWAPDILGNIYPISAGKTISQLAADFRDDWHWVAGSDAAPWWANPSDLDIKIVTLDGAIWVADSNIGKLARRWQWAHRALRYLTAEGRQDDETARKSAREAMVELERTVKNVGAAAGILCDAINARNGREVEDMPNIRDWISGMGKPEQDFQHQLQWYLDYMQDFDLWLQWFKKYRETVPRLIAEEYGDACGSPVDGEDMREFMTRHTVVDVSCNRFDRLAKPHQIHEELWKLKKKTESETTEESQPVQRKSPFQWHTIYNGRLQFNFPTSSSGIENKTYLRPRDDGSFRVSSGTLLWGQLHSVVSGAQSQAFDNSAAAAPPTLEGGNIMQHFHKFRCAARMGNWNIRRITTPGEGHFGWIVFHDDVDPHDALNRAAHITPIDGISNRNRHIDKDVLYVGRYGWSTHARDGVDWLATLRDEAGLTTINPPTEGYDKLYDYLDDRGLLQAQWTGHLLVIDAEGYDTAFLETMVKELEHVGPRDEILYKRASQGNEGERKEAQGFGAFVTQGATEYELGWLVFSSKKHEQHRQADELVAIIYDATYQGLEGEDFNVDQGRG